MRTPVRGRNVIGDSIDDEKIFLVSYNNFDIETPKKHNQINMSPYIFGALRDNDGGNAYDTRGPGSTGY